MPSFVNIGAWVGSATMVDTWATVGSCAQIGANVHLAGGVGIGGVLEPANAVPVVIESVPEYGARYALAFNLIEIVSLVVFTVEYGLRLWVAVEHGPPPHLNCARARVK